MVSKLLASPIARFFLLGASVLAAVLATMVGIVLAIPEVNDFARAAVLKHDRLDSIEGPKVVLVGGSNLAYGIDTLELESIISCPVVNMGMNGYLGVDYMLAEVTDDLHTGDTVVLAFEWDNFVKETEGSFSQMFAIVKVKPAIWEIFTWPQRLRLLAVIPSIARDKVRRLSKEAIARFVPSEYDTASAEMDYIVTVENFAGFNEQGDLTSQAGKTWPFALAEGLDLTAQGIHPEVPAKLNEFGREMKERGVRVVLSYSPVARTYFNKHADVVAGLHDEMLASGVFEIPRPPVDYVYDDAMFFDESYHLISEGRSPRTRQLGGDLLRASGGASPCGDGLPMRGSSGDVNHGYGGAGSAE